MVLCSFIFCDPEPFFIPSSWCDNFVLLPEVRCRCHNYCFEEELVVEYMLDGFLCCSRWLGRAPVTYDAGLLHGAVAASDME